MKKRWILVVVFGVITALASGCSMPKGYTAEAKREYTLQVRDTALQELWERSPEVQEKYNAAAGDLFLSNFSFHLGWITFANGYGVIEDHATKERKYVRMFRFGIGPGLA